MKITNGAFELTMNKKANTALTEKQLRRTLYNSTLLTMLVPPFIGTSIMGIGGFYPMPEIYLVFTNVSAPYVLFMTVLALLSVPRAHKWIVNLGNSSSDQAYDIARRMFARLPWYLLLLITVYSIFGAISADISLENMGLADYSLKDHLLHQFGLIPVILITTFPVFFYFIDQLGRYLAPRGIHINAIPLWIKMLMLGIVTPLLIDSLLIGYFYNRTGYFETETLIIWFALLALAIGGTRLAWRSIQQGLLPLQAFVDSDADVSTDVTTLEPLSLDELGVLTARYAEALSRRNDLEHQLRQLNEQLEQHVAERTAEVHEQYQRNEVILQTTPEGFFSADTSGRIHDTNPAFCKMLGYSEEELLQLSIADIEAQENSEQVAAHIDKVMKQGTDTFETVHRRKDGSTLDVEISTSVVAFGQEIMFYAFARDISERKRAVQVLIQTRNEAERANAAKSEFLSRMSHELRTPLNAIIGFTQVLQHDKNKSLSEAQHEQLNEVSVAGYHLLSLVNEVLDLSRIESGYLDVQQNTVLLAPVVESCVAQIGPLATTHSVSIAVNVDKSSVIADESRLKQVILNLLSNAIKYNHKGGKVQIQSYVTKSGAVRVVVKDTGRGIATEDLPRLFRPFERLSPAYDGIEGTGIGLSLSKCLVEAMGGGIHVKSKLSEGSTFWFSLEASKEIVSPQV